MAIKLVTTLPFHGYAKGQEITDPEEVARLQEDREHHFVRVFVPDEPKPAPAPSPAPEVHAYDNPEHHDA